MERIFIGILAIPALIGFCGLAILANQDAALSGKYAKMDQALYSIMSR